MQVAENVYLDQHAVDYANAYLREGAPRGRGHRVFALVSGHPITLHGEAAKRIAAELHLTFSTE